MGGLLIKTDASLPHGGSVINQIIAFKTARTLAANSEQKQVLKAWKTGGEENYKEKRAAPILRSAEEMAGIKRNELTALGPKRGKIQVGAGRLNRSSEGSSASWCGQGNASNDSQTQKNPAQPPQENAPIRGNKNGKGGFG